MFCFRYVDEIFVFLGSVKVLFFNFFPNLTYSFLFFFFSSSSFSLLHPIFLLKICWIFKQFTLVYFWSWVERFFVWIFIIFRKPTYTNCTIPSNYFHLMNKKMASFHSFFHRLLNKPLSRLVFLWNCTISCRLLKTMISSTNNQ